MIKRLLLMGFISQFFIVTAMMAQVDRATLTGSVTDPSGAAVPGVTVTATHDNTHVATKTETNAAGLYRIMNLPVGPYTVAYEKAGFKTVVRSGIVLNVAQVAEINIELSIGAVSQRVEVTAGAPVLETETAEVGTAMTNREVENLPMSISGGRLVENFAYAIMPNVDGNNWTSYIAGTPAFTKSVLLDGTIEQGSESGSFDEMFPSMDAVQEFKVDTGGMSGQTAANTAGGTFMITMKSGTNQWHGSAFEFSHNEALNANTWTNNYETGADPTHAAQYKRALDRENDYGFSLGGPIKKNKTFFYWAWERYMLNNFAMGTTTVPTADFLKGNFSALLGGPVLDSSGTPVVNPCTSQPYLNGQILDPATSTTVGGQACAMPFAGNTIPASRISSVASKLASIYQQDYAPINGGTINNALTPTNGNPWFRMNQYSLKLDHNISNNDRLSGSYIGTSRPRYLIDTSSSIWQQGTTNGGPLSQDRLQTVSTQQLRASENHNFSPTTMNVASFTALSYVNPSQPLTAGGGWAQKLGLGQTLNNYGGIPEITFGNAVNGVSEVYIGENNTTGYVSNIFAFDEIFTKIHGRHTLNFGGTLRDFQMNGHAASGNLTINFTNDQTGQPQNSAVAPYVGFGFASFLLGDVNNASEGTPLDLYGRRKELSLYASDIFKVNRKLTLTLSLTWNQNYSWHEKYGNWANFNTTLISPAFGIPGTIQYATGPGDSFEGPLYWKGFAPSIGVAYQVAPKVVVRGSYSMFYTPLGSNYWEGVPYGYAPQARGTDFVNKTGTMAAAFNWDSGYPGVYVPGSKDPNYLAWGPVTISPQSLTPGRINQWNIGAEIELSHNTRLSAYYLGNRGTNLPDGELQNDGPTAAQIPNFLNMMSTGNEWDWIYDAPSSKAAGVNLPYPGFQGFAYMADSSFPQAAALYSPLYYVGSPLGKSRFDSFTAEITRRMAPGLSMDMSYGFEHQASDLDPYYGNFAETWVSCDYQCIQDITNPSFGANYVRPYNTQIVKGFIQYDLPFGKGRRFLSSGSKALGAAVGGWRVGLIVYYTTGVPLTADSSNYYPGWPSVVYSNVTPGTEFKSMFQQSGFNPIFTTTPAGPNEYFTPSSITNPSYGALGNSGPWVNGLYGFGYADEDLGIYKEFSVSERVHIQLRGEFFNSLNRHFFSNPVTNISSPLFGYVTGVNSSPRQGQVGVRITF
jgi:hypothetical protein